MLKGKKGKNTFLQSPEQANLTYKTGITQNSTSTSNGKKTFYEVDIKPPVEY